ncbi:MAG: ferredoxin [Candidatus Pacebacteria bacterium]|nr:ferredoxin [Candidatus Paceibacterota bacterium]MDD2756991.1 ferredoxin [Candidatus Paceibacterota bacterium]MDD3283501.1 ferredoxin [Candidatus Paceibacterota bacterium]MDD3969643.1 ferredoxin [Candidatus Paceibacterota bacterium]MDD4737873.1 ferredoxin [Candidatus Paceibacterota bacterium]
MENTKKEYKINKEKCIGCGSCSLTCSEGTEMDTDGKAIVISSAKLEECGGVDVCPYGAIEIDNGEEIDEEEE